jgi:uncharacterized repeat protein (TIGR01451 family)
MVEWFGRRHASARLGRQVRFAVLAAALAGSAATALLVGPAALGRAEDKVCDAVGCAQLGYEGQITTLWIQNTASSGGPNITGESLSISGTPIIGVSGTTLCQAGSNILNCGASIMPGDIFTASPIVQTSPPVGTSATVTLVVGGVPNTIDLQVQSTSLAGNGSSPPPPPPPVAPPPPPPPPRCAPRLYVEKTLHVHVTYVHGGGPQNYLRHTPGPEGGTYVTWPAHPQEATFIYEIKVTNKGNCEARGVSISDDLPLNFRCSRLTTTVDHKEKASECSAGELLVEHIGTLAPGESAVVAVRGDWTTFEEGKVFFNIAYAKAKSPPLEAKSEPPVAVKVVSEKQFEKTY